MKRALTIAGSDSGGGAGIQADLKTFSALGVYGMSVLTALTAQNTLGVQAVFELPPSFVAQQIDSVVTDIGVDAVKTGMLANSDIIHVVAEKVKEYRLPNLVVDPVMRAKSGDPLLRPEAQEALVKELLPLAMVVTPNLPEAEALVGFPVRTLEDMRRAAIAIHEMGPAWVVVKGGHLEGDISVDVLYNGKDWWEFTAPHINTRNTHGTGCTFASAIAAWLARGADVPEAVRLAKEYLTEALKAGARLSLGKGHGPVHHFALLYRKMGWEE
ncbi:MAG: bifunctional hydroxymethylpyrimidine kinase/phosphomethylpyrimidine kinase [Anaerolineae bacterium]|nr:bifunctional hydroxymethylpyrimidine kinase/phosphomethylpyrimidine kinase [Anaerolineae bacterium]MDW8102646.1 bifunctional hydroxymethylpyrimidine kinase/phosphomethylpyrimidine kinase [Anaerolineae bacterium]